MLYVVDEAEKQALLLGEPRNFFTTPGYDGWPLVMVRLAEVDVERLAELVTDAWRMRAPAALAGEFGGPVASRVRHAAEPGCHSISSPGRRTGPTRAGRDR